MTLHVRYGEDDVVCAMGMDWLDGVCSTIEDWGCGPARAKHLVRRGLYVGVDSEPGEGVDIVTDLRFYRSAPDGIFMRHVLERSEHWPQILSSALASFRTRMALIVFTPFGGNPPAPLTSQAPGTSPARAELLAHLAPFLVCETSLVTGTGYDTERVFLLARELS